MLSLPKQLAKDVSSDFLVGDRRTEGVSAPIPVTVATASPSYSTASGLLVPVLLSGDNPCVPPGGVYADPNASPSSSSISGATRRLPPLTPLRLVGHLGFASVVPLSLLAAGSMQSIVTDLCTAAAACAYFSRGEYAFSGGEMGGGANSNSSSNAFSSSSSSAAAMGRQPTSTLLHHLSEMDDRYPSLMASAARRWMAVGGTLATMGRRSALAAAAANAAAAEEAEQRRVAEQRRLRKSGDTKGAAAAAFLQKEQRRCR